MHKLTFLAGIACYLLAIFAVTTVAAQDATNDAAVKVAKQPTSDQQTAKDDSKTSDTSVQDQESEEEPEEDVVDFYRHPGFQLMPSSKTLSWRNVLKNSLYYDSNYFLTESDEKGGGVYAVSFLSQLDLRHQRFQAGVDVGASYRYYFRENDLDEFLPYARLRLQYEDKVFYCRLSDEVARSSTVNSLSNSSASFPELNQPAVWWRNTLNITVGMRQERILAEVGFSHVYVDFRHLDGDYLFYGCWGTIGYELSSRVDATLTYRADWIDYLEAIVIDVTDFQRKRDTLGHSVLAGVNVRITRQLDGHVGLGFQSRDSHSLLTATAGLTWRPTLRWRVNLEVTRQTMPSFVADFQDFTSASLTTQYLITQDLAVEVGMMVAHAKPRYGDGFIGYYPHVTLTYRIYKGIEVELFYRGVFKRSDQADRPGLENSEYDQHIVGGSLNLIF
jgi:hypothetical protein